MTLKVTSETGKLASVLIHLPGPEIDRMVPSMLGELLFDDILFGSRAREEHRRFQQVLGYVSREVLDAQDLLAEVLDVPEQRSAILDDLEAKLRWGPEVIDCLRPFETGESLAAALVAGVEQAAGQARDRGAPYCVAPLPNYFFQRD
ncbi:MAG TPA: arginine deiminase family protein, partial [Candidatus Eisenbacteria bacterium]